MRKRIIALITSLIMMCSFIPTTGLADETILAVLKPIEILSVSSDKGTITVKVKVNGNANDPRLFMTLWNAGEERNGIPGSLETAAFNEFKFGDGNYWYHEVFKASNMNTVNGGTYELVITGVPYGQDLRNQLAANIFEDYNNEQMSDADIEKKVNEEAEPDEPFKVSHTWTFIVYNNASGVGNGTQQAKASFECDESGNLVEEEKEYTITYNNNGGNADAPSQSKWNNKKDDKDGVTLANYTGEKTGCKFVGWSTNADGSGTVYKAGDKYNPRSDADTSGNVTLYAVWKQTASVVYDVNGGTGSVTDSKEYLVGDKVTLKGIDGVTAPSGKPNFEGWKASNGTVYQPNAEVVLAAGVNTFTAQWAAKKSATVTATDMNVDYGTTVTKADIVKNVKVDGVAVTNDSYITIDPSTIPTNAGTHTLTIKYDNGTSEGQTTLTLIINKVSQTDPTITGKGSTTNSITFNVTDGAKYMVKKSSENQPYTSDSGWTDVTSSDDITVNGLDPNTEYAVYAYMPGDENHTNSSVVKKNITTQSLAANTLKLTVDKTQVQYGDTFTVTASDVNNTDKAVNFPETLANAKRKSVSGNTATYQATDSTGSVTVTVTQDASSSVNGATVTSTAVTLTKRVLSDGNGLDFSDMQAVDKVYDGNNGATIVKKSRVENEIPKLTDSVAIADGIKINSCVGTFETKDATGVNQDVTLTVTITDSEKSKHYTIGTTPKLSAKITKRPVKVGFKPNLTKIYGDNLALTVASHLAVQSGINDEGLLSTESISDLNITAIACDGTPSSAAVGAYDLKSVTQGDSNYTVSVDSSNTNKLTVVAKAMTKPTIGNFTDITANSFKADVTSGAKYAITKKGESCPDKSSNAWTTSTGTVTKTDCDPNTEYVIWAYTPATDGNHSDSETVSKSGKTINSAYTADMFEITDKVYNKQTWSNSDIAGLISKKSSISANVGAITVTGVKSKSDANVTTAKDADTYTVTFDVAASGDYSAATGLTIDWTIEKAEQTLTVNPTSVAVTVDSTKSVSVSKADEIEWSNITVTSGDTSKATVSPATLTGGTFEIVGKAVSNSVTVTVTSATTKNYKSASATVTVEVTAKPLAENTLAVSTNKSSVSYGDTFRVNISGNNNGGAITYTPTNAVEDGRASDGSWIEYRVTNSTGKASVKLTQAATDTVKGTEKTVEVTLSKRVLTINKGTLAAADKVYDATTTATVSGAAVLANVVGSDDVSLTGVTGTFAAANAATGVGVTLSAKLDGTDKGHYELGALPSLSADITARPINVWLKDDMNKTYGDTLTIEVANLDVESTGSDRGLAPGKSVSDLGITAIECDGTKAGTAVGQYPIKSVTGNGNYAITVTGDKKVNVTATSGGNNKMYPEMSVPAVTFGDTNKSVTMTSLPSGATVEYKIVAAGATVSGDTWSSLLNDTTYAEIGSDGKITVKKAVADGNVKIVAKVTASGYDDAYVEEPFAIAKKTVDFTLAKSDFATTIGNAVDLTAAGVSVSGLTAADYTVSYSVSDGGTTGITAVTGTMTNAPTANGTATVDVAVTLKDNDNYVLSNSAAKTVTITVSQNVFTVKFNGNGGMGATMTPQTVVVGDSVTLSTNTFERTGYLFDGWAYTANATTAEVADGETITFTVDNSGNAVTQGSIVTLYAVWKECKTLTVTSGEGGDYITVNGVTATEPIVFVKGESADVIAVAKSGYVFKEWQATGITLSDTMKTAQSITIPVNDNITLTATYKAELTVTPQTKVEKTTSTISSIKVADFIKSAETLMGSDSIEKLFDTAPSGANGVFTANGVTIKFYTDSNYTTVDTTLSKIPSGEGTYYYTVEVTADADNTPNSNYVLKQTAPVRGELDIELVTNSGNTGIGGGGGGTPSTPKPTQKPNTDNNSGSGSDGGNGGGGSDGNGGGINGGGVPSQDNAGAKPTLTTEHIAYIVGREGIYIAPEENITRAEVATIFFRLLTEDVRNANYTKENGFVDSNIGDWYNAAVSTLAKLGIVNGRTGDGYQPSEFITRAEFTTIAARFSEAVYDGDDLFYDIAGHWAEGYINSAASIGWIEGENGIFRPDDNITRAEVMTIVNRMLGRQPKTRDDLIEGMTQWVDNDENAWYYLAVQEATNSHEYERNADGVHEKWTTLVENPDWDSLQN